MSNLLSAYPNLSFRWSVFGPSAAEYDNSCFDFHSTRVYLGKESSI